MKLNLVINAFFLYCKLFMYLKISDIISFVKLDKSRCISLLLCFWHINCPILMVIYPNNYSNFRTIMEVIMKNKWLLCILLMLFLPFGLFAQVAPPLEKQKTETQEAPENNNEVTTNSDTNTDGDVLCFWEDCGRRNCEETEAFKIICITVYKEKVNCW